jgi:hypothetical protein
MRKKLVCINLLLAAILVFAVASVGAQPTQPYPIGELTLKATQVAAGVGYTWGSGTLKFEGKEYPFTVKGLNVAAVGISTVSAKGDVYNLKSVADFPGTYAAAQAGAALIKGPAGLIMKNTKGVLINLKAEQTGVQINLGAQGMEISMK